jgi:hypothetical protein
MLQLNPTIPIYIPHMDLKGYAIGWIDYSEEQHLYWIVALDNTEIWTLPNTQVRMQKNITLGRV